MGNNFKYNKIKTADNYTKQLTFSFANTISPGKAGLIAFLYRLIFRSAFHNSVLVTRLIKPWDILSGDLFNSLLSKG